MTEKTRPRWDEFAGDDPREITRDTVVAHERMIELARDQFGDDFEYGRGGATLRLRIPSPPPEGVAPYVVEVRGQSSVTANGRQGADPERLAQLRELEEPVLLVFVETGAHVFWAGWLDQLPEAEWIAADPTRKRLGWRCKQLSRFEGTFVFPVVAYGQLPPPEAGAPAERML